MVKFITDRLDMTVVVDWDVKPQNKQINFIIFILFRKCKNIPPNLTVKKMAKLLCSSFSLKRIFFPRATIMPNIYIFIAIALDETSILVALHFLMQNIYQSCDLGHAVGQSNDSVSQ